MNWVSAVKLCRNKGTRLVSIQSQEENEFVKNMTNNNIWIGLQGRGVFRGKLCLSFYSVSKAFLQDTYVSITLSINHYQQTILVIQEKKHSITQSYLEFNVDVLKRLFCFSYIESLFLQIGNGLQSKCCFLFHFADVGNFFSLVNAIKWTTSYTRGNFQQQGYLKGICFKTARTTLLSFVYF